MDLIKLLFQKAKSLDSYDKLDDLVQIVGKNAKHNLTASEIKSLASMYLSDDIEFKSLNSRVKMITYKIFTIIIRALVVL